MNEPGYSEGMFEELNKQIDAIEGLRRKSALAGEFALWRRQTEDTLEALYGKGSNEVQEFNSIYYTPVFLTCRMGDEAFDEAYRNGLEEARRFLQMCMRKIQAI